MKIKKVFALLSFLLSLNMLLNAQVFTDNEEIVFNSASLLSTNSSSSNDSLSWSEKKHPFVGLGGMLGFNLLLSTWNRYMIGSGWAKTGWEEWDHFWERELKWDNDWYWTNFVLHPYQGSLYYMSARGANLNQLESFGVTFVGSYLWEFLCECNSPSKHDMIYTTVGSFVVGEMLYRLSSEANEINRLFGIALNPQRLWTEYLWRIKPKESTGNIYSLSLAFNIGTTQTYTNLIDSKKPYKENEIYPVWGQPEINIVYNDPYTHDSNVPYSQFNLKIQAGLGKGSGYGAVCNYEEFDKEMFYQIKIISDGMLFSRVIDLGDNKDTSIGIVMEYDFDWHSFYQLSSLAPGFAIKQRCNYDSSKIEWQAHLAGVLLGTSDFYYAHRPIIELGDGTTRTYSMNVGLENVLRFKYEHNNGHSLDMDFHGYALYDFYDQKQAFASTGWEFLGFLDISYEIPLSNILRLGLADNLYVKYAAYKDIEDVFQMVNSGRIFVKFKLK